MVPILAPGRGWNSLDISNAMYLVRRTVHDGVTIVILCDARSPKLQEASRPR